VPNARAAFFLEVNDGAGVAIAALSANAKLQNPPNNPAPAIWAFSDDNSGVQGISQNFDAIVGESSSPAHAGVIGRNTSQSPGPDAVGVFGEGGTHAGLFNGHLQVNGGADIGGDVEIQGKLTASGHPDVIIELLNRVAKLEQQVAQLNTHVHEFGLNTMTAFQDFFGLKTQLNTLSDQQLSNIFMPLGKPTIMTKDTSQPQQPGQGGT
jgi:hypothetical protein